MLKKIKWEYIIVDEAHNLKNEKTLLSKKVRETNAKHRILLTGSPFQNQMKELWSLMNYIMPEIFTQDDQLSKWFRTARRGEDIVRLQF